MGLPRLIITGSSGLVGRHLVETLRDRARIFGIARRSQPRCGVSPHPNLAWFQADIGEEPQVKGVFEQVAALGGADVVIHLAAHHDQAGEGSDEYWRTNVLGLRNVLDQCVGLHIKHFILASAVAACRPAAVGETITETTAPLAEHVFGRTKGAGEQMLGDYYQYFRCVVVRFAALFSDWCENPPLSVLLQTWLSEAWNRRLLGGRGRSAKPYLHVHDAVAFLEQMLDRVDLLEQGEVLLASPDGCVSHRELFGAVHVAFGGERPDPVFVPRALCGAGLLVRDLAGRLTGERPFERPWMARYIDTQMPVDAARTRQRLDWAPRPRLAVLRRMPFLVENLKTDPVEWNRRNREAMRVVSVPVNLKIHWLLERHESEIIDEFNRLLTQPETRGRFAHYHDFTADQHEWHHRLILRQLVNAVRTSERGIFMAYCRDLAERRLTQGFDAEELCGALEVLNLVCFRVLRRDPETKDIRRDIYDHVTVTLKAGCDQAQEVFEQHEAEQRRRARHLKPA